MVGTNQPLCSPDYKVAIQTGDKNVVVVLDVYAGKDYIEIVGWRMIDAKGLERMKRQTTREGGQFLILSPKDGSAAALSALPGGVSSGDKGSKKGVGKQTGGGAGYIGEEEAARYKDGRTLSESLEEIGEENEFGRELTVGEKYVLESGDVYRVKTTIKEYRDENTLSKTYSYEVQEIELLDILSSSSGEAQGSHIESLGTAKLLENCEIHNKSGKKLLDESQKSGLKVNKSEVLTNGELGASCVSEIDIIEKILL